MSEIFCRSSAASTEGGDDVESAHDNITVAPVLDVTSSPRPDSVPRVRSVRFLFGQERRNSGDVGVDPSSDALAVVSPPAPGPETERSATRERFRHLVRSAVMVYKLTGLGNEAMANASRSDQKTAESFAKPRSSRVAGLLPKLQNMTPIQDIAAHAALVRYMQVSIAECSVCGRC